MSPVPVTLTATAAAVILNIWLGWRVSTYRHKFNVSVGDGGHEPLLRRMRAQANFIENAPFFLLLVAGLELSGGNRLALAIIAALFILARIAHGFGMDGGKFQRWRRNGIMASTFTTLALAIWALVSAYQFCLGR
jgi:uncharacterized membrane protein YecN with MAPEG domain